MVNFVGVSGEEKEYWEAVDVFEKIYASKFEVVAAGRRILQAIYSTADERRDDLDINQIRQVAASLHAPVMLQTFTLSRLSTRCNGGWGRTLLLRLCFSSSP